MEAPQLRRGPFGYTFRSARLVLADRDRSLAEASARASAAEAKVLDYRSEAETLKMRLAEQAEQLGALGAELAELRTDRDAARRELEGAVADAARLQLELSATRRELETVRHDPETTRHGSEIDRGEPNRQEEPLRAAEEGSGEIALIRQELSSARQEFLIQSQRVNSAETRIEELEAEVRSLRPELEAGLSAAVADLEAARAAVDEAAARPAPDPSVTEQETPAPLEAAGWTMARMNGAGTHAQEELGEAERARRETLAEIERLEVWRDRLAPLVGEVRSTIEDARERAAGIGDRIDEAVGPLTEAIGELSDRLAAFAELAALPGEDTREPASERSLDPIELEPRTGEASGQATQEIVRLPGPPPVDQAQALGAERPGRPW